MSVLTQAQVAQVPELDVPVGDDGLDVSTFQLFAMPALYPARLETVFMQCNADPFPDGVQCGLNIVDQSGFVIASVYSALADVSSLDVATLYFTWMRGGSGDVQLQAPDITAAFDLALPDLVLPPQANLTLTVVRTSDAPCPAVTFSNIFVTFTPGSATAGGDTTGILPLLVPSSP